MGYKSKLQSNNVDLQKILDMILALGLVDATVPWLTFKSDNPFTLSVGTTGWDGKMYYSLDKKNWNEWNGSAISGNAIYVRGEGNTKVTGDSSRNYNWTLSGSNISCIGNIETLLDYKTVSSGGHPAMADNCYHSMFNGCTSLTTAPSLPATTLASYCYHGMFSNCTSLTEAPSLPATTLADYCYSYMFYGCTSLTTAPSLPATTLADKCYYKMFYGCTSLKLSSAQTSEYTNAYRIPTSGTGTTASNALSDMFTKTGGTFTGAPSINTTYYLHSSNSIV